MMSGEIKHRKIFIIILIPLILNALVYLLMFVPKANELVVYFDRTEGGLAFGGGPLRFSSHVISALYILYLLYLCFYTHNTYLHLFSCFLLNIITVYFKIGISLFIMESTPCREAPEWIK